jgi:DNA replication licensing factor MCM2
LYAELREQSAASGGVPIAVRHLESMVRMAEASAKMHLRDYVRDDDVDLAIKITLQSFLQAQKISVRRALQSKFKQYLTYREENNRLLLHQLVSLMNDAEKYQRAQQSGTTEVVQVFISDLQKRASDLNIFDLKPFFNSKVFKSYGMEVNERSGMIVKRF